MSQNRIIITSKGTTSKLYMKQATEICLDEQLCVGILNLKPKIKIGVYMLFYSDK